VRRVIQLLIAVFLMSVHAGAQPADSVVAGCPTLTRLLSAGKLDQIKDPVFTDRKAARLFSVECARVARELDRFSALPPEYAELREQAALAAEFLSGDTYVLSTSEIKSVVRLRQSVRIPPPSGFVYLRKYASTSSMPPVVRQAFRGLSRSKQVRVQGVTMRGRYIAILHSEYPDEFRDVLAHEMVHAYLSLAAGTNLPTWFQEGAAVYFSTGAGKLYNHGKDASMMEDVTMPGDYKSALHSFEFIEKKVGREKLFEFIRHGVETGSPDPRWALSGVDSAPPEPLPLARIVVWVILIGGALAGLIAALKYWRREEMW
jgi:hypothetical protein